MSKSTGFTPLNPRSKFNHKSHDWCDYVLTYDPNTHKNFSSLNVSTLFAGLTMYCERPKGEEEPYR